MRRRIVATPLAAAVLLLGGCTGGTGTGTAPAADGLTGPVAVSAAASLTAPFDELAAAFTDRHPGVRIVVGYDGSATLATQIIEGAPVDVFASADEATMHKVVAAGRAAGPQLFATNTLTLIVPAGNPGAVTGVASLADEELTVVLCAPEVPCGAASHTLLAAAGVRASVDSFEQNVSAVLAKVAASEVDAGLVYVTDAALAATEVETIETAGADTVVNRYPVVVLDDAPHAAAAEAFVAFVRSPSGQAVLADHGFGAP